MQYFSRGITISTRKLPDDGPGDAFIGVVHMPSGTEAFTRGWRRSRHGARADAARLANSLASDPDVPIELL